MEDTMFGPFCGKRVLRSIVPLLLCANVAAAQNGVGNGKVPVPDEASRKHAEELLREVYGPEYDAAKSSVQRAALAKKLVEQAEENRGNPVECFVLLRAAREMAIQAVDAKLALQATDRLATWYDVDGTTQRVDTFQAVGRAASKSSQFHALADQALPLIDAAVREDRFDAATRAGELGVAAARRARQYALAKQITERMKEVKQSASLYRAYQDAMVVLEDSPIDPSASLTAGRFLCFFRGDWRKGIPLLALAKDQDLQALAVRELKEPRKQENQVALADAWWDLAATREGREKEGAMLRAGAWYKLAETHGSSGLLNTKIETRLREIARLERPIPRLQPPAATVRTDRPLPANARLRFTLKGHQAGVNAIAFSPDGTMLASNGVKEAIRFWDPNTGTQLKAIAREGQDINNIAFSPDGKLLASVGAKEDRTIRFFDTSTDREIRTIAIQVQWLKPVVFSPDGAILAATGDGGKILFWEVESGKELMALAAHKHWAFGLAFSPDGQRLASGGCDRMVRIWDVQSGEKLQEFQGHQERIWSVAYTPDGNTVASSAGDKTIILWDPQTGRRRHTLEGHTKWVRQIAISPDGRVLASAGYDSTVRLWSIEDGKLLATLRCQGDNGFRCVAFSPDGKWLASGGSDHTVRLWELYPAAAGN